jgi:PAS domain S-box-containing protein
MVRRSRRLRSFVNQRWLDYTGLSAKQALGSGWQVAMHPDDLPRILETLREALNSAKPFEVEGRFRRFDGEFRWFLFRGSPLRDRSGKVAKWYGTNTDHEERKRAEDALLKSEERWRSVFENSAIGVALTDLNGSFLATNHVYQTIVGYTEEELRALCFLDITHGDYREANWALITELLEGKREQFQIEKKYLRKDGSSIWVSNNVSLVPGTERVPRFIMALAEDITQRKRAEEALQRSEGYLAEAQKLTHTGSWAVRVPQMENAQDEAGQGLAVLPRFGWNASYWSKEMYRIFGLDPDPTPPSYMEVVRRLHPEDARYYTPVVEEAIRDRTDFETDYRLLLPNGAAKYIHVVGHPIVNASGDVIELVGTAMDVTEQHEARAALQTAFEQIKAEETELRRMTDAIASYICVLRPDGTALYANQTVLDYLGLTLEDVQREDLRARIIHAEDVERLREERREGFVRGKPFELEQRELGKDGKYRWFLVRHNPLRDNQGNIIRWYATGTDIEDRKQTEERLRDENVALREEIDKASMFEEIVGNSSALQTVLSRLSKVAPTDSTVLVTGETGTGKELVARAIHRRSQRSSRVFVSVNCAAIPRDLIASELFGHEKGAFTGATQQRLGRFELANGGTIFLDEVGELPAETQIALLRVLQEHEFQRVGGTRSIQTDARVIAATNRDLEAAIAEGTFRSDLFYRLHVFPIEIPPLRERREDIHLLVEYFIDRYARKTGKKIRDIERSTLELLRSYAWPGNIRELQNVIERSLIVCETQTFSVDESWLYRQPLPGKPKRALGLSENLVVQEKEMIEAALRDSGGRVSGSAGAAARLGMPGSTLESKIRSLKINKNRFKPDDPSTSRI